MAVEMNKVESRGIKTGVGKGYSHRLNTQDLALMIGWGFM